LEEINRRNAKKANGLAML